MANSSGDRNVNPLSPTSQQHQEIKGSTVEGGVQELHGNENRTVQGKKNRTVQGEKNTVIQGSNNLLLQIQNLVLGRSSEEEKETKRSPSQHILIDKVKAEINGRLEHSLHNRIYILLDKKEDPRQVRPLWSMDVKIGMKDPSPLPQGTKIEEIYDRDDINGKLLILGAPGSGKTTTLLQLAQTLVQRAEEDEKKPIPVLFNLSSWQPKSSIFAWAIEQLNFKYTVNKDIAKQWLEDREILPLLDGLDELTPEYQAPCVIAINEFLHSDREPTSLVVCSRTKEYNLYQNRLGLNGSIILQYLDRKQIERYLEQAESKKCYPIIQNDCHLLDLAKIPLLLNIMIVTFQGISIETLKSFSSSKEKTSYLFDTYIQRMFGREYKEERTYSLYIHKYRIFHLRYKEKQPNNDCTIIWLNQISQLLLAENKTDFFIEKIQPNWLENKRQELIYGVIFGLIFVLSMESIYGVIFGLSVGMIDGLAGGLSDGLIFGSIIGLVEGLTRGRILGSPLHGIGIKWSEWTIETVEQLNFSIHRVLLEFIQTLILGLSIGLIYGIFYGFLHGLIYGLTISFTIGLIYSLTQGFVNMENKTKNVPNQGIKKSIINIFYCLVVCTPFGMPSALLLQLLILDFDFQSLNFYIAPIQAIFIGLLLGLFTSGTPVIKHFSLRLVLWWNKKIPWNYARFLDYACDRLFLQRVGGGYCFLHRLLQEHFAEMENFEFGDERRL
ncbi:MAG: NACHT domain-containing NTPase [Spirulina sp.]